MDIIRLTNPFISDLFHSNIASCIVLYLVSEYAYLPLYIWVSHGSRASDESGPIISESGKREELAVMYAG